MTDKSKTSQVNHQPTIKYVKSPEYRSTYANNVAYVVSSIDFSLIFGQILEGDKDSVVIEQNTRVAMTPVQAKILAGLLTQQVFNYEQANGEIKFPPGISIDPQQVSLGNRS